MPTATRAAVPTGATHPLGVRAVGGMPAAVGRPAPLVVIDLARAADRFRELRCALPWAAGSRWGPPTA